MPRLPRVLILGDLRYVLAAKSKAPPKAPAVLKAEPPTAKPKTKPKGKAKSEAPEPEKIDPQKEPDKWREQHGKCPHGWRYSKSRDKCVPREKQQEEQKKHKERQQKIKDVKDEDLATMSEEDFGKRVEEEGYSEKQKSRLQKKRRKSQSKYITKHLKDPDTMKHLSKMEDKDFDLYMEKAKKEQGADEKDLKRIQKARSRAKRHGVGYAILRLWATRSRTTSPMILRAWRS